MSKVTWKIINQAKWNYSLNIVFKVRTKDGNVITGPQDPLYPISNAYSDFLVDEIVHISTCSTKVTKHIERQNESMFISPYISSNIENIISALKTPIGFDGVLTRFIKSVSQCISKHLSLIMNLSITIGTYLKGLDLQHQ